MPNFFQRKEDQGQNSGNYLPYGEKKGPKRAADGQLPDQNSGNQPEIIAHPQITPAETEAQLQPALKGRGQKQEISQLWEPMAEGPQKIIAQAQPGAQQKTDEKPPGCHSGGGHPKSRCRQLPDRGSS